MAEQPFNTQRVEALKAAGLIATCTSECGGTGAPTLAVGPDGESLALSCDCNGTGWYVTDEAERYFEFAAHILKSWPGDSDRWGRHAALSCFLIEFAIDRGGDS